MKTDQTSEKFFTYNNIPVRKAYSQKHLGMHIDSKLFISKQY